jgi:V-type H+-transporting ATPase subunit C
MSRRHALVSLPLSAFDSGDKDDALRSLSATISPENANVYPFAIPDFKIGTLDALVQFADDLAKLETACETAVTKVSESLNTILEGEESKLAQHKVVNDSQCLAHIPNEAANRNNRAHRRLPTHIQLE